MTTKSITRELTSNTYLVRYSVGATQNGLRLDHFLMEHYRRRSREAMKRAIESGAITINRGQSPHLHLGKLKPSTQLLDGDEVLVLSERRPEPPVNFDYRLIYEDEVLFVIEKPANLPVHPSGRFFFNTLLIHLKTQGHTNPVLNAEELYFLAHRIDKETSGILVLAKNSEACAHIVAQFAARKTEKAYFAIVKGHTPEKFEVSEPLARSRRSKIGLKMECTTLEEGGATAHTAFERLEIAGDFSLVKCYPKTGRQHQIRVHLEKAGHPIVGDKLYGVDEEFALLFYERERLTPEAEAKLLIPRHALHSCHLSFTHPTTGKKMAFDCALPADLQAFFDAQKTKPLT